MREASLRGERPFGLGGGLARRGAPATVQPDPVVLRVPPVDVLEILVAPVLMDMPLRWLLCGAEGGRRSAVGMLHLGF